MQRILSTELARHTGETVTVAGWVHRRRLLKSVGFLILRDASGLAQVVMTPAELEKLYLMAKAIKDYWIMLNLRTARVASA